MGVSRLLTRACACVYVPASFLPQRQPQQQRLGGSCLLLPMRQQQLRADTKSGRGVGASVRGGQGGREEVKAGKAGVVSDMFRRV